MFSLAIYCWALHTGEVSWYNKTVVKSNHKSKRGTEAEAIPFLDIAPVIFGLLSCLFCVQRDIVDIHTFVKFRGLKTPSPRVRPTNIEPLRATLNNWGGEATSLLSIARVIFVVLSWLFFHQQDIVKNYTLVKFRGIVIPSSRGSINQSEALRPKQSLF